MLLSLVNPDKKAGCMGPDRLAPFFVLGMCVDILGSEWNEAVKGDDG